MRVTTLVSPLLAANVHVVGEPGGAAVVVDPGAEVADDVVALVARDGLDVRAVLLTHGHVDHTWSAAELGDRLGVPVVVHEADAHRLADPVGTLGPLGHQLAAMVGVEPPPAPADVRPVAVAPGRTVELRWDGVDGAPGLRVEALHCPGHTEGSTVYLVGEGARRAALTGDVLFAGTIGRTDLPGGDERAMAATLRRLAALDPGTRVLPGHGPATTVGAERAVNPYLRPGT